MMDNNISIAWVDMSYSDNSSVWSRQKTIINQLNGYFSFGSLNALMGPSGSGKTTLLKCLSGRNKGELGIETKIFLSSTDKIRTCFISQCQTEHLLMSLTVGQLIIYASKLKNSGQHLKIDHQSNAINLMKDLMISDIENTIVKNCSGGEQKRVAIALELTSVIKPNMLCIDEPTTGLDSDAAENVVMCLKKLSQKHKITVIASIHQPNNDLLMMFNKLYVLAKNGVCVYSGQPQELGQYLRKSEIVCDRNEVPIEVLLKIASNGTKDLRVRQLADKNREEKQHILSKCQEDMKLSSNGVQLKPLSFKLIDIWYLLLRTMIYSYVSQWKFFITQLLIYIFYGMIVTKLFNPKIGTTNVCFSFNRTITQCKTNLEDEKILGQNIRFNLATGLTVMFIQLAITTMTFTTEMKIFLNEHQNRWYSTGSYYWAKTIVETSQTVIISFFYSAVVYFVSNQITENGRYFGYLYLITIAMLCTQSLGNIIGIIFDKNIKLALTIGVGIYINLIIFCNFFLPLNELEPLLQLFSDLTYTKLLFNSILTLLYGFNRCPPDQLSLALYEYNIEGDQTFWINSKHLLLYFLVLRFIALAAILIKSNSFSVCKRSRTWIKFRQEVLNAYENKISIEEEFNAYKYSENHDQVNCAVHNNLIEVELNDKELAIAWVDLTFRILPKLFREEKIILNRISGGIDFGSLNALMGPSGAGKSTLLKCINGMNKSGLSDDTKIYLSSKRRVRTCFIKQDMNEHLLKGLTVKQTLVYSSKLKNCDQLMDHEFNAFNIMNDLMLNDVSDTFVEKCSGGQQRRIVIASELSSTIKPNMLCIDEPTSGLDSDAAEVVIKCLKDLSLKHNIATITSIHQPNSDLLLMFHKLYVLAKGGVCVFSDCPQKLEQHLNDCKIQINIYQSPIEQLLKVSSRGINDQKVKQLSDRNIEKREELLSKVKAETFLTDDGIQIRSKRFKLIQLWYLFNRTMIYTFRTQWKAFTTLFMFSLSCCYFMSRLYNSDMGKPDGCIGFEQVFALNCFKEVEDLEDLHLMLQNSKFFFSILFFMSFLQMFITTLTFPAEVKIFMNEHRNGWYSTGSYYLAKFIVELIPTMITIISYCLVTKFSTESLSNTKSFLIFTYVMIFSLLCSQSLATNVGIIFNENENIAILVSVAVMVLKLVFCNILIPINELHYTLQWFSHLSPLKLGLDCIFYLIYGFDRCKSNQISIFLYRFHIKEESFWINLRILVIYFVSLRLFSLFILIIKANRLTSINYNTKPFGSEDQLIDACNSDNVCIHGLTNYNDFIVNFYKQNKLKPKLKQQTNK